MLPAVERHIEADEDYLADPELNRQIDSLKPRIATVADDAARLEDESVVFLAERDDVNVRIKAPGVPILTYLNAAKLRGPVA